MCHPFFASAILPQPTPRADFPSPLYGTWHGLRSRKMQPLAGRNHQAALQHQGEGNEQLLTRYSMVSTQPNGMRAPHTTRAAPHHVITSRPAPWAKKIPAPKRCGDAIVFKKRRCVIQQPLPLRLPQPREQPLRPLPQPQPRRCRRAGSPWP